MAADLGLDRALADAVLLLHAGVVLFVVGGLVLVVLGNLRGWDWVNARWLRALHLGCIAVVVAESWWGVACPLTTLEAWLRRRAGQAPYESSFVEHWVARWLYWDAPTWVFVLAHTVFAALVVLVWRLYPPRRGRGRERTTRAGRTGPRRPRRRRPARGAALRYARPLGHTRRRR